MPEALGEAEHLIAALLGLPSPTRRRPEKFRHDLMGALHAWLLALARETPIVLAGEDLQWSDPSTLEVLRVLQDRLVTAPVLIVLTKRPDCDLGFTPRAEMVLDRLDASDARSLARRLAARRSIKPRSPTASQSARTACHCSSRSCWQRSRRTPTATVSKLVAELPASTTRWTRRGLGDGTDRIRRRSKLHGAAGSGRSGYLG